MTPEELVQNVLVGSGVTVSNVTYEGDILQRGSFTNGESTNLGLSTGIILTSGDINDIPGDCDGIVSKTYPIISNVSDPDLAYD